MKFKKEKTQRGFDKVIFEDDYKDQCSIQISSNVIPHIWIGIENPNPLILAQDAIELGIDTRGQTTGWVEYPIDQTKVIISTRMHLTRKQSFKIAMKLIKFALFKRI